MRLATLLPIFSLVLPFAVPACRAQEPQPQAEAPTAPNPDPQAGQRRLAVVRERLQKAESAGPGADTRLQRIALPLAKLQAEKAEEYAASAWGAGQVEESLAAAEKTLDLLAAGKDPFAAAAGLQERAYFSPADGSAQPYWVYVPKRPAPGAGWPVLIYLHGYVPDTSKINPWLPDQEFWNLAEEKGFLVLVPYGRRNTDFEGIGEQDVLAALDEAKRYYPVDADRVTLTGPSMGGYGVYVVGLHYPHLFAGLAPMCGRSIPFVVEQRYPDQLPPFKKIAAEANIPLILAANAKNLPLFIQQGENDFLINPDHSRRLAARWKALGYSVRYDEWKGHDHYIYWERKAHAAIFDWAADKRRVSAPRAIDYTTYTPKYGQAYWITVAGVAQWGKPARVQARVTAGNVIRVTATNLSGCTLTPPAGLLQAGKPLTIVANGRKEVRANWQPGVPLTLRVGDPAAGPRKSATLCGPVRECFQAPFLLVPGTLGDEAEDARLAGWAQRWAEEWRTFADGEPPIRKDTEVTSAEMRAYNLVLFGDRRANALLARMADQLPVELTPTGYRIGKLETPARDLGLLMNYPNPLAPERLVCVYSGIFWGDGLDPNHKFDLAPDFILFRNELDGQDPARTPRPVCAGYFNSRWQLDDTLTWKE